MENNVVVPQKIKAESPYNAAIPLVGMHPKNKSRISKKYLYIHILSSIIHNSQKAAATQVPTNRQMDK